MFGHVQIHSEPAKNEINQGGNAFNDPTVGQKQGQPSHCLQLIPMYSLRGLPILRTALIFGNEKEKQKDITDQHEQQGDPTVPRSAHPDQLEDADKDQYVAEQMQRRAKFASDADKRKSRLGTSEHLSRRVSLLNTDRETVIQSGTLRYGMVRSRKPCEYFDGYFVIKDGQLMRFQTESDVFHLIQFKSESEPVDTMPLENAHVVIDDKQEIRVTPVPVFKTNTGRRHFISSHLHGQKDDHRMEEQSFESSFQMGSYTKV
jgi:hypothetical protein